MSTREALEAREEVSLMMDWGNTGWGAGEWMAMSVFMTVFWGGLAVLGVWLARRMRSNRGEGPADRAETLLAERFARGEIDGKEFTRSRELLHTAGSSSSHSAN